MTKTVELTGSETMVEGLGGKNTAIYNKSDGAVYASCSPNIIPNADGVIEIPAGGYRGLSDTNGIIYVLGTGNVELTGTDSSVNFKLPSQSQSGGGGSTSDVTKAYVDAQDSTNLGAAKAYTDTEINEVKEDVSDNADSISALQIDVTAAQTAIAANAAAITATDDKADAAQSAADNAQIAADNAQIAANEAQFTADANTAAITTTAASTLDSAKSYTDTKTSALDTRVTANETAIAVLNGTGEGSVKKAVSDGIATVVADAPESLDTLKEISDWISSHSESAAAMNSQIQTNTSDIAALGTSKADKTEIPTTLPANGGNADTVNGHTVNMDVPADAKFTDTTYKAMTGASASAAGKSGLVPAPTAGNINRYLNSNGIWNSPFASVSINTADTNLNSYTSPGLYLFTIANMPINPPSQNCLNGWLLVIAATPNALKQIWFNLSGGNNASHYTFIRTKDSDLWSNWQRFETISVSAATTYGTNQEQADKIMSQLAELDNQTMRPLRAIEVGTATDEDRNKLREIEAQAETLRAELKELGGGE